MTDSTKNELEKNIKKINREYTLRKAGLVCSAAGIGYFLGDNLRERFDNIDAKDNKLKEGEKQLVRDTMMNNEAERTKRLNEIEAKYNYFSKVSKIKTAAAHVAVTLSTAVILNGLNNFFEIDRKRKIARANGIAKYSSNKGDSK